MYNTPSKLDSNTQINSSISKSRVGTRFWVKLWFLLKASPSAILDHTWVQNFLWADENIYLCQNFDSGDFKNTRLQSQFTKPMENLYVLFVSHHSNQSNSLPHGYSHIINKGILHFAIWVEDRKTGNTILKYPSPASLIFPGKPTKAGCHDL